MKYTSNRPYMTANIILSGERLKAFIPWNKTRQPILWTSPVLFSIVLEVLAIIIRQEKEIKDIRIGKEEVKLSLFSNDMILYIQKILKDCMN